MHQGNFSGEHFYDSVLEPLFIKTYSEGKLLEIDLDYTTGFGPSFFDETFGKLAKRYSTSLINKHIYFKSKEIPRYIKEIQKNMEKNYNDTKSNV